jgi:hypothetical protein
MSCGSQVQHRLRHATGRRLAQICVALAVAGVAGAMTGQVGAKPALAYACTDYGWQYDVVKIYGSAPNMAGTDHKSYNGSTRYAPLELASSVTGSIGVTVSVSGTFNINAIVSGAQLTTSVALEVKYTWTTVDKITISVPPKRWGNGIFGPLLWKTYGHYYYLSPTCVVSSSQYVTTYVPENAVGWYTWISTT